MRHSKIRLPLTDPPELQVTCFQPPLPVSPDEAAYCRRDPGHAGRKAEVSLQQIKPLIDICLVTEQQTQPWILGAAWAPGSSPGQARSRASLARMAGDTIRFLFSWTTTYPRTRRVAAEIQGPCWTRSRGSAAADGPTTGYELRSASVFYYTYYALQACFITRTTHYKLRTTYRLLGPCWAQSRD